MADSSVPTELAKSEITENSDQKSSPQSITVHSKKRQASPSEGEHGTPSKIQKFASETNLESGKENESTLSSQKPNRPQNKVQSDHVSSSGRDEKNYKTSGGSRKRIASDKEVAIGLPLKRSKRERENSDASYDDLNTDDNEGKKRLRTRKKFTLKNILEQMEFYFSDSNLGKDRFLKQIIDTTTDGYVDISVFEKFNKLQSLHKDGVSQKLLLQALKGSSMLEVNKEGTKVRRTTPIKTLTQEEIDFRTVYVENLPGHASHSWLRTIFSKCGKVTYISLPCYRTSKDIKGFAFIEFDTPDEATKACTMLNNPENLEEKPGKFPKWNNTLYRLQRFVPIQMETDGNEENVSADKKGNDKPPDSADSEGEGKKKKKKKPSKRKSSEGAPAEERLVANPTDGEASRSGSLSSSKDPPEIKKKKKKRKRRNSQSKDDGAATKAVPGDPFGAPFSPKSKCQKVKTGKGEDEKGTQDDDKSAECKSSKLDAEGSKKKRKKKKKKKGETKGILVEGVESKAKNTEDLVKDESTTQNKDASQNPSTEKITEADTNKLNEESTDKPPEPRPSAKERKRLRQADIQRKKELRALESKTSSISEAKVTSADEKENAYKVEQKTTTVAVATEKCEVTENEIDDATKGRRKSDGSELTSILKSKKAAERKRVEFDPVPITTEFERTREIRRRKKVKRDKLHLRVITKHEWVSLKAEYIARQKSHMAALKESLRELRQQESEDMPAKPQDHFVDLHDVFKIKRLKPGAERLIFTPNVVVQWNCTHELHRDKLRTMFKGFSGDKIAYIDCPEEAKSGYIRFKDEASAEEFAKMSMGAGIISARMLPAEQQKAYWEKANEDRMKKLKSKRNEQGCDKLARKVFERNKATFYNKPSRIVFNDDDDGGSDKSNNINSTKTDSKKGSSAEINVAGAEVEGETEKPVEA